MLKEDGLKNENAQIFFYFHLSIHYPENTRSDEQPFSPAAGTGLSSHELNQPGAYREVKDVSAVALFKLKTEKRWIALRLRTKYFRILFL